MADPRIRILKIKTGILKRITKEKFTYQKEVIIEQQRYEKFKNEGVEELKLKKQLEVIQESEMMVPDCHRRMIKAHEDLQSILDSEQDLKNTEEYKIALQVVEEAMKEINPEK